MKSLFSFLDGVAERRSRRLAQQTSRRSLLVGVSKLMVASAFTLPVLPFDRTSQAHAASGHGGGAAAHKGAPTDTDCDYCPAAQLPSRRRRRRAPAPDKRRP